MESINNILYAFGKGLIDSVRGIMVLGYLDKEMNERNISKISPTRTGSKTKERDGAPSSITKHFEESKVLRRFLQGCFLNGFIFLLSIILFNYGALPAIKVLLTFLFGESSSSGRFVWGMMEWVLSRIFEVCWVIPLFFLIKVINYFWFQDIADSCFRFYRGRPQFMSSLSKLIADSLFSTLVEMLFLIQSMLVSLIPIMFVAEIAAMVHICLLYSLYAFEYKWFNLGWELHRRLTFIENNWPYFIGFGLPLAILTTQLTTSLYISGSIFSILFPIFIISGNEASPVTNKCEYPLRLFSPVVTISNYIFHHSIKQGRTVVQSTPSVRR